MPSLSLFSFVALLWAGPALGVNLASLVQRQDVSTTSSDDTYTLYPAGEQKGGGSLESTIPISCDIGCYGVTGAYFYCFVIDTLVDGSTFDRSNCSTYICNQTYYDQLYQCLNCIVANGDERPYGYYTNTSKTAAPTPDSRSPAGRLANPNGLVNLNQSNQILSNITGFCNGVSSTLTGETSITASPTTTGPYYTSWTSGQNVQLTVWEGLQSYSSIPVITRASTMVESATSSAPTQTQASPAAASSSSSQSSSSSRRLRLLWFEL